MYGYNLCTDKIYVQIKFPQDHVWLDGNIIYFIFFEESLHCDSVYNLRDIRSGRRGGKQSNEKTQILKETREGTLWD